MASDVPMPPSNWSDYYEREGTTIDIDSLPTSGGFSNLEKVLLSPSNNPWGSANTLGIYIIDCENKSLKIRNCRIRGTLLIKNVGSFSGVYESVDWTPAVANFPALLVNGNFVIQHTETSLSEATHATNFNSVGSDSDADLADRYPSRLFGLCYVTGIATIGSSNNRSVLYGCLVCGTVSAEGDLSVYQIPNFRANAPPGFREGPAMRVIPETWKREE